MVTCIIHVFLENVHLGEIQLVITKAFTSIGNWVMAFGINKILKTLINK